MRARPSTASSGTSPSAVASTSTKAGSCSGSSLATPPTPLALRSSCTLATTLSAGPLSFTATTTSRVRRVAVRLFGGLCCTATSTMTWTTMSRAARRRLRARPPALRLARTGSRWLTMGSTPRPKQTPATARVISTAQPTATPMPPSTATTVRTPVAAALRRSHRCNPSRAASCRVGAVCTQGSASGSFNRCFEPRPRLVPFLSLALSQLANLFVVLLLLLLHPDGAL
mmetsp:Transcript_5648/g.13079  ORF Transcript_5648/g.13079 Transcript_5648/m.13079 type:complete len:228 (-) Transcript_5648:19-702(-)